MNKKQNWLARMFGKAEKEMSKPLEPEVQVSRAEIGATVAAVTPEKQINPTATVAVGGSNEQVDVGATMVAEPMGRAQEPADLSEPDGTDWNVGDVILDLYEVVPVREGNEEKPFHDGGGMGKVYKVHHRGWDMDMAVKCPRPHSFATEEQKARFAHECEVWVNLGLHPHTVSCHYIRYIGGIPRVFAEYIDGGSLKDWIDSGRLYEDGPEEALERILDIAIQFAWGLHYAHEQGLVHQDVKPANVMMTPDGTAKVTDFGLANARHQAGVSVMGGGMGTILVSQGGMTPAYCSPEQAHGEKLSRRTDVWSWAVSVLEMFQGDVTWQSGSLAGMALEAFLPHNGEEEGIPSMPDGIAALLRQCFQEDQDDRPRNMLDCVATLAKVYESTTGQTYWRTEPKPVDVLADGLNNRALSFLDLGKPEEAERLFDEALRLDPHHLAVTYNRGLMLWRSGRMTDEKILESLRGCEQSLPNDPHIALYQGWIQWGRGDFVAALERFKKAAETGGGREARTAMKLAQAQSEYSSRCLRTFEGHTKAVHSVCLSADGRWALSGSKDHTLRLWDTVTGQCIQIFKGHTDSVNSVCLNKDRCWVLSGSSDHKLKRWDVATGQCLRTFEGHVKEVHSVCLSTDGRWVLSGSHDNTLKLWDSATGYCLHTFKVLLDSVNSVCLCANDHWALYGGGGTWDKTLKLWDVATGQCLQTFEGHTEPVHSVCMSADGCWALSGSGDTGYHRGEEMVFKLWDVATGKCLRTFEGHTSSVRSVCLSTDNRWALSGSSDNTVRLWDVVTGQCLRTFEGHTKAVHSVCLSADGRWALSGSWDNTLRLWRCPQIHHDCKNIAFLYSRVMSAQQALDIRSQIQIRVQEAMKMLQLGKAREALDVLRALRKKSSGKLAKTALDLWVKVGRCSQRKGLFASWPLRTFKGHTNRVNFVCLSADGQRVLSGSDDDTLRLWDVATGQCLRTFEEEMGMISVTSVCLSRDGLWALSGSQNNILKLWSVASGQCVRTFEGHTGSVNSVCLSADGRWALSGSKDKTLKLWDVATGQCLRTLKGHTTSVHSVCLSTDGRWTLSGSGDYGEKECVLKLWDTSTGVCLRTIEGHMNTVKSVSLSADGHWALSGSADMTIKLWDVTTGQCLRTFDEQESYVRTVFLSANGHWALSGCRGNTLKLWDVATGQCQWKFEGHRDTVSSVCLSADGRWALSGSADKTLILWELDWDYEAVEPADWDEGAQPYLENFLTLHTPYAAELPTDHEPSEEEISLALTRRGRPLWSEDSFQEILETLANAGYGWLRPEGVKHELEKIAANWQGPPPMESM